MTATDLKNAVAAHPFLRGMSEAHLRNLLDSAMFTRFEAGQVIFREGEVANRFYLIQKGKVSIQTHTDENRVMIVQAVGPGDVLGWSWLFAPYYWHFDASAVDPTDAIFFYGTRLREKCEEDRDFGYHLMRRVAAVLMQRLQMTVKESLRLAGNPSD